MRSNIDVQEGMSKSRLLLLYEKFELLLQTFAFAWYSNWVLELDAGCKRAAKADKIESWKIDFIKLNLALTNLISLECETAAAA